MDSIPVSVGLDYHDSKVQVCVLNQVGELLWNRDVANDALRIDAAVRRHGQVSGAAIETCCGSAHLADELATRFGWPIALAHPGPLGDAGKNRERARGGG